MNTTIETTNPPTDHQLSNINNQPTIRDLPKPTRDMINFMLEDALPYRVILDELAETGRDLTPHNDRQIEAIADEFIDTIRGNRTAADDINFAEIGKTIHGAIGTITIKMEAIIDSIIGIDAAIGIEDGDAEMIGAGINNIDE